MKNNVVLAIRGQQTYAGQDPEVIELVTEGTMVFRNGGWDISYEESALTGLEGVTTTFRVEPGKVLLTRNAEAGREKKPFCDGLVYECVAIAEDMLREAGKIE